MILSVFETVNGVLQYVDLVAALLITWLLCHLGCRPSGRPSRRGSGGYDEPRRILGVVSRIAENRCLTGACNHKADLGWRDFIMIIYTTPLFIQYRPKA